MSFGLKNTGDKERLCGENDRESNTKVTSIYTSILIMLTNEKKSIQNFIPQREETAVLMTYTVVVLQLSVNMYVYCCARRIYVYRRIFPVFSAKKTEKKKRAQVRIVRFDVEK